MDFTCQNLPELLQSDIRLVVVRYLPRLSKRAVPNWGRAYHGNATKHSEETNVEGTHVSANVWYPLVRRNTYEMRGRHTRAKNESAEGFKTTRPL